MNAARFAGSRINSLIRSSSEEPADGSCPGGIAARQREYTVQGWLASWCGQYTSDKGRCDTDSSAPRTNRVRCARVPIRNHILSRRIRLSHPDRYDCSYSCVTIGMYSRLMRNLFRSGRLAQRGLRRVCELLDEPAVGTATGSGPREDCSTAPRLQRFYAHDIHPRNVPVAYIAVYFESCNWSTMLDGCRPVRASQQSL